MYLTTINVGIRKVADECCRPRDDRMPVKVNLRPKMGATTDRVVSSPATRINLLIAIKSKLQFDASEIHFLFKKQKKKTF